jgi:hypothetical protein
MNDMTMKRRAMSVTIILLCSTITLGHISEEEKQTEHPHSHLVYCGSGMRKTVDAIEDKTPRRLRDYK